MASYVTLFDDTDSNYLNGKLENEKRIDLSKVYFPNSSFRIGAYVSGENSSATFIDGWLMLNYPASEEEIQEIFH